MTRQQFEENMMRLYWSRSEVGREALFKLFMSALPGYSILEIAKALNQAEEVFTPAFEKAKKDLG